MRSVLVAFVHLAHLLDHVLLIGGPVGMAFVASGRRLGEAFAAEGGGGRSASAVARFLALIDELASEVLGGSVRAVQDGRLLFLMDVRVGGTRHLCMAMQTPNGEMQMWFVGEFKEVVENRRLVYTDSM